MHSLYVEEKLSQVNKRDKRIAEKRISGIFETEMAADISRWRAQPPTTKSLQWL